jgi:hypothetical protein
MAIKSINFGITPPPAAPAAGTKLFFSEAGELSLIAPGGVVSSVNSGRILFFLTKSLFPQPGGTPPPLLDRLYIAEDEFTAYKWTGTTYRQLQSSLDAGVF